LAALFMIWVDEFVAVCLTTCVLPVVSY
jgi:hypothetical protein